MPELCQLVHYVLPHGPSIGQCRGAVVAAVGVVAPELVLFTAAADGHPYEQAAKHLGPVAYDATGEHGRWHYRDDCPALVGSSKEGE